MAYRGYFFTHPGCRWKHSVQSFWIEGWRFINQVLLSKIVWLLCFDMSVSLFFFFFSFCLCVSVVKRLKPKTAEVIVMFPGWKSRGEPIKAAWGIRMMALQNTQWKKSNLFLWSFRLFIQTALWRIWQMRQRAPEAAGGPIDAQHAFSQQGLSLCVDHLIGGRTKITHVLLWYLWPCDWQRSRVDWSINNWGNKGWANVGVICLTSCFQGYTLTCGWSAWLVWISVKLCISFLLRENHIHLVGYLLWYYHTYII